MAKIKAPKIPIITRAQLVKAVEKIAVKTEKGVDTNNAWGFGGARKDVYHLADGRTVHVGTAYYRHIKSEPFINVRQLLPNGYNKIVAEGVREVVAALGDLLTAKASA